MKEVFIPDTNERYSVREDGTVWSHHCYHYGFKKEKLHRLSTKVQNNRTVTVRYTINGKSKTKSLALLVLELLSDKTVPPALEKPSTYFKDGNFLNCSLDNLDYYKAKFKTGYQFKKYPEASKINNTSLREKYKNDLEYRTKTLERYRKKRQSDILTLHPTYIRDLIRDSRNGSRFLSTEDLRDNPEILQAKREQLKLHRYVNNTRT